MTFDINDLEVKRIGDIWEIWIPRSKFPIDYERTFIKGDTETRGFHVHKSPGRYILGHDDLTSVSHMCNGFPLNWKNNDAGVIRNPFIAIMIDENV